MKQLWQLSQQQTDEKYIQMVKQFYDSIQSNDGKQIITYMIQQITSEENKEYSIYLQTVLYRMQVQLEIQESPIYIHFTLQEIQQMSRQIIQFAIFNPTKLLASIIFEISQVFQAKQQSKNNEDPTLSFIAQALQQNDSKIRNFALKIFENYTELDILEKMNAKQLILQFYNENNNDIEFLDSLIKIYQNYGESLQLLDNISEEDEQFFGFCTFILNKTNLIFTQLIKNQQIDDAIQLLCAVQDIFQKQDYEFDINPIEDIMILLQSILEQTQDDYLQYNTLGYAAAIITYYIQELINLKHENIILQFIQMLICKFQIVEEDYSPFYNQDQTLHSGIIAGFETLSENLEDTQKIKIVQYLNQNYQKFQNNLQGYFYSYSLLSPSESQYDKKVAKQTYKLIKQALDQKYDENTTYAILLALEETSSLYTSLCNQIHSEIIQYLINKIDNEYSQFQNKHCYTKAAYIINIIIQQIKQKQIDNYLDQLFNLIQKLIFNDDLECKTTGFQILIDTQDIVGQEKYQQLIYQIQSQFMQSFQIVLQTSQNYNQLTDLQVKFVITIIDCLESIVYKCQDLFKNEAVNLINILESLLKQSYEQQETSIFESVCDCIGTLSSQYFDQLQNQSLNCIYDFVKILQDEKFQNISLYDNEQNEVQLQAICRQLSAILTCFKNLLEKVQNIPKGDIQKIYEVLSQIPINNDYINMFTKLISCQIQLLNSICQTGDQELIQGYATSIYQSIQQQITSEISQNDQTVSDLDILKQQFIILVTYQKLLFEINKIVNPLCQSLVLTQSQELTKMNQQLYLFTRKQYLIQVNENNTELTQEIVRDITTKYFDSLENSQQQIQWLMLTHKNNIQQFQQQIKQSIDYYLMDGHKNVVQEAQAEQAIKTISNFVTYVEDIQQCEYLFETEKCYQICLECISQEPSYITYLSIQAISQYVRESNRHIDDSALQQKAIQFLLQKQQAYEDDEDDEIQGCYDCFCEYLTMMGIKQGQNEKYWNQLISLCFQCESEYDAIGNQIFDVSSVLLQNQDSWGNDTQINLLQFIMKKFLGQFFDSWTEMTSSEKFFQRILEVLQNQKFQQNIQKVYQFLSNKEKERFNTFLQNQVRQ